MKAFFPAALLAGAYLFSGGASADSATDLLVTDDWGAEADEARRFGTPIIILFTDEGCGYCKLLKKEVLEPLMNGGDLGIVARVRELDIDRGGKIRDFDGEKIRTRMFVDRYGVYATPTLMMVDYRGEPLGAPIVGFNGRDGYLPYLEHLTEVAYREPEKTKAPCEQPMALELLDADLPQDALLLTHVGGSR